MSPDDKKVYFVSKPLFIIVIVMMVLAILGFFFWVSRLTFSKTKQYDNCSQVQVQTTNTVVIICKM